MSVPKLQNCFDCWNKYQLRNSVLIIKLYARLLHKKSSKGTYRLCIKHQIQSSYNMCFRKL